MIEFNIPNHEKELEEADALLKKIHSKVTAPIPLGEDRRNAMLQLTNDILYLIGEYSQPIFDLRTTMEEAYSKKYIKTPALGKELYLKHYESLHKPYDKIKNKVFKLIEIIDPSNVGIADEIYL